VKTAIGKDGKVNVFEIPIVYEYLPNGKNCSSKLPGEIKNGACRCKRTPF